MKPSGVYASYAESCPKCGKVAMSPRGLKNHTRWCGMVLLDFYWPKVDRRGPSECWPWIGSRKPRGYGHLSYKRKDYNAHRLAWTLANGPIPTGLHVLHKCDNPPCQNPAHLFLGDHDENMADRSRKGRGPVRLSVEKVRAIRAKHRNGSSQVALQKEYGVSPTAIYEVVNGRSWKWVQ